MPPGSRRPRAPPPPLPDELVEAVLLRVPPDDPATLACRRWRRILADPAFRRRRLDLHRATPPPMLGVVCDGIWDSDYRQPFARFVSTSSFIPRRADHRRRRAFDARHGRVLLNGSSSHKDLAVWDPITNQLVEVPKLPRRIRSLGSRSMKATVLCSAAATGGGACDHLDCHRGPFTVVMVGTNDDFEKVDIGLDGDYVGGDLDEAEVHDILHGGFRRVPKDMFACVYSSESGEWSEPTYAKHQGYDVSSERSALVGNTLYFVLRKYESILKYDLGTRELSTVELPYVRTKMIFTNFVAIELTALEDGRLGLARVEESNELCLWSRDESNEVARDHDSKVSWEVTGWTLYKIIDLKKLFPLVDSITLDHCLVGFCGC